MHISPQSPILFITGSNNKFHEIAGCLSAGILQQKAIDLDEIQGIDPMAIAASKLAQAHDLLDAVILHGAAFIT